jgi:hypothetical protein
MKPIRTNAKTTFSIFQPLLINWGRTEEEDTNKRKRSVLSPYLKREKPDRKIRQWGEHEKPLVKN